MPGAPLRGRSAAVGRALDVLRSVRRTGRPGTLRIHGEAGIGKTALLDEIVTQARGLGFRTGTGKADEIGQVAPGAPVLLALRAGERPLATAADVARLENLLGTPLQLIDAIAEVLQRIGEPVLLAVDDAQWADRLSLLLLRTLPERLAGLPFVWVTTSRETGGDDPDGLVLGPLDEAAVREIALDRLGREGSAAVESMLVRAGGNPFLVTRILAEGGMPAGLLWEVRDLLAGLPAETAYLVRVGAVLGRPFATDEAAELAPGGDAGQAVRSRLLKEQGFRYAFRHDLLREAVYGDLSEPLRRELHRRCAEFLLARGASAAAVAAHARAGAEPGDERAAEILVRAADEVAAALPDVAGDLAVQAFRLLRPAQDGWARAGENAVRVLGRAQRASDAVAVADELLARIDDPESRARLQVLAARALWLLGRPTLIIERVDAELGSPRTGKELKARLAAARALALTRLEPAETSGPVADAAVRQARATGDAEALELALQAAGEAARNAGHHARGLELFRELRQIAGVTYLALEIVQLQLLDRYDEAARMLAAAQSDAAEAVEAVLPSLMHAQLWQDFNTGAIDDAIAGAEALIEVSHEAGDHMYGLDARMILAAIAFMRDDLAGGSALVQVASVETDADDDVRLPGLVLMQGWQADEEGDPRRAVEILSGPLYSALESRSYWPWWPGWLRLLTMMGRGAEDDRFVDTALAVAEEGARRNPGVVTFQGIVLQLRGLRDDDVDLLRQAVEVLRDCPRPFIRGAALGDLGSALLRAGFRSEAIERLNEAWDIFHALGSYNARYIERLLRQLGVRREAWNAPARPVSGWESLTVAERRVATLISAGHTNREAASRLGVSPNTVGTHLRNVFSKLEVQSRVQLANAVNQYV